MYEITRNTDKSSASAALTNINSAGRWLALGGVYHGGIQVPGLAFSLLSSAQPHSRSAMQCGWGPGVWRGVVLRLHGDSWHWRLLLHAETEPNVRGDCCSRVLERGSRSAPAVRSCRDGKSAGTPSGRASRLAKRGSAPLRCATSPGAGSWDDLPGTAPNALACRAQVKLLIRRLQVGYAPRSPCCAALPGASCSSACLAERVARESLHAFKEKLQSLCGGAGWRAGRGGPGCATRAFSQLCYRALCTAATRHKVTTAVYCCAGWLNRLAAGADALNTLSIHAMDNVRSCLHPACCLRSIRSRCLSSLWHECGPVTELHRTAGALAQHRPVLAVGRAAAARAGRRRWGGSRKRTAGRHRASGCPWRATHVGTCTLIMTCGDWACLAPTRGACRHAKKADARWVLGRMLDCMSMSKCCIEVRDMAKGGHRSNTSRSVPHATHGWHVLWRKSMHVFLFINAELFAMVLLKCNYSYTVDNTIAAGYDMDVSFAS